ncbi:MAG: exodeoxyribonuclease VII large subunit [Rhodoferax sp.]
MTEVSLEPGAVRVWPVGALCRAVAEVLDARFNPVRVAGEISGFSRAASGHCYFSLKDESGQLRCAMFRRSAALLDFAPRDGDRVEVFGRVGVYEPRGDLQLVVESMRPAGQGRLFEQFLQLKAKLAQEGLFDPQRKRPLPSMPRGIGVVTSLGAAAWHDVVTALQRRVPHIPVLLAPASVQGEKAAQELAAALMQLYALCDVKGAAPGDTNRPLVDLILLVRGGGAMEDLWAFNDETLARTIARSPVPVISGVGHETDFTIADFVADVRAPTPTAAAELVCQPRQAWLSAIENVQARMQSAVERRLDQEAQRLELAGSRIGRPSARVGHQSQYLIAMQQRMQHALRTALQRHRHDLGQSQRDLSLVMTANLRRLRERTERARLRLGLLDPSLVLKRGYAWLADAQGHAVYSAALIQPGQPLQATLADGVVDLTVVGRVDV